jgi:hypothetical protein
MLRSLRRCTLAPTLRRLMAVLLAFCVSVAFAEPMIVDSCDEDAPRSEAPSVVTEMGSAGMLALGAAPASPTDPTGTPQHAFHLCHCSHAHGSTLTARHDIAERVQLVVVVLAGRSDRRPPSVFQEPQLRPPRVLGAA